MVRLEAGLATDTGREEKKKKKKEKKEKKKKTTGETPVKRMGETPNATIKKATIRKEPPMASSRQFVELIRQGRPPGDILALLKLAPSEFWRLMTSKRVGAALEMEAALSDRIARHNMATSMAGCVDLMVGMAKEGDGETARKACQAVLDHGLAKGQTDEQPQPLRQEQEPMPDWYHPPDPKEIKQYLMERDIEERKAAEKAGQTEAENP